MNLILLHYRYTPSIAGVELVMEAHARLLAEAGHRVTVLTGAGATSHPGVEVESWSEFLDPTVSAEKLKARLLPRLAVADRVILHNVLTMPFHLRLTRALWELAEILPAGRLISWVHDLAAINPDYPPPPDEPDWALLCGAHPRIPAVAISALRAREFHALTGRPVDAMIPNGIDPFEPLCLPPAVQAFAQAQNLAQADLLLLHPTRIVRRKNIGLGLRVIAALRDARPDWQVRLLITGLPDAHQTDGYDKELLAERTLLGLEQTCLFVNGFFRVAKTDLSGLYQLCDVLWFPSLQEGFGLPLLESAVHRLLTFTTDLPPMNELGLPNAIFFRPDATPAAIAEQLAIVAEPNVARRRALSSYHWKQVLPRIETLLESTTSS